MAPSLTTQLIKRDSAICHYCSCKTNRVKNSDLEATKDHVVPRSFGGRNAIDNYVLACRSCNNKRGTTLFYCKCSDCSFLISMALMNDNFINEVFSGIVKHNKPVVKFQAKTGHWVARMGHAHRKFETWNQAVTYAREGTFLKGE